MKKIIQYLKDFYKTEFKAGYFLALIAFLSVAIYVNYGLKLTANHVRPHFREEKQFFIYTALFSVPLLFSYISYAFFYKKYEFLKKTGFWVLFLLAVLSFSFRSYFYLYRDWIADFTSEEHRYFWIKCGDNLMKAVVLFIPAGVYWYFKDKEKQPLYGFTLKGYNTRPYLIMLAIMAPLVAWASFQSDFLSTYPTGGNIPNLDPTNPSHLKYFGLYELCYGFDFIFIEFFFRGFLVLAFAKYVGKGSILPMTVFYVVIHFGKPLGETISSFFGGLTLGIIAYYSRSIAGGVIVHLGVAWMMEIGAFLKKIFG